MARHYPHTSRPTVVPSYPLCCLLLPCPSFICPARFPSHFSCCPPARITFVGVFSPSPVGLWSHFTGNQPRIRGAVHSHSCASWSCHLPVNRLVVPRTRRYYVPVFFLCRRQHRAFDFKKGCCAPLLLRYLELPKFFDFLHSAYVPDFKMSARSGPLPARLCHEHYSSGLLLLALACHCSPKN